MIQRLATVVLAAALALPAAASASPSMVDPDLVCVAVQRSQLGASKAQVALAEAQRENCSALAEVRDQAESVYDDLLEAQIDSKRAAARQRRFRVWIDYYGRAAQKTHSPRWRAAHTNLMRAARVTALERASLSIEIRSLRRELTELDDQAEDLADRIVELALGFRRGPR